MAAWWIMLLVAAAVAAAVVARSLGRHRPAPAQEPTRRSVPGSRARPAGRLGAALDDRGSGEAFGTPSAEIGRRASEGAPLDSPTTFGTSTGIAPPADIVGPPAGPTARAGSPAMLVELFGLVSAPSGTERPWDELHDRLVLGRILGCASEVLDRVAARRAVLDVISDPSPDPRALTDIVVSDPTLSARVLRTVNSPAYALRHPMASVFRAVLYLGHLEVRNIVWRACLAEAMAGLPGADGEMLDATWRHSFAVSRVAYAVARTLGVAQPDLIATAALLHDAGKLVVLAVEPEKAREIYRPLRFGSAVQLRREWEVVGIGHGLLGGEVVRAWGLPAEVAACVEHHHLPSFVSPDHAKGDPRLVGLVHVADLLCHAFARADTEEVLHLPVAGWLSDLGVSGDLSSLCDSTVLRALRSGAAGAAASEGEERAA
jgi:putative nucleotidyltransferase with HDIG domain